MNPNSGVLYRDTSVVYDCSPVFEVEVEVLEEMMDLPTEEEVRQEIKDDINETLVEVNDALDRLSVLLGELKAMDSDEPEEDLDE